MLQKAQQYVQLGAQIDRTLYKNHMRKIVENIPNLSLMEAAVDNVIVENGKAVGVILDSQIAIRCSAVVLSAGTFLNGKIFVGLSAYAGGRVSDPSAIALGNDLMSLGLPKGRLKTGTPARLDGRTIDFRSALFNMEILIRHRYFSFLGSAAQHPEQIPCWITNTNTTTHDIIRNGLDRSPLYTGIIEGIGPRYCPSIEDKIHRFASKDSHHVFWNRKV